MIAATRSPVPLGAAAMPSVSPSPLAHFAPILSMFGARRAGAESRAAQQQRAVHPPYPFPYPA